MKGSVCDVTAFKLTKKGKLRHAVFIRFRDDIEPITCTLDKLITDFQSDIKLGE